MAEMSDIESDSEVKILNPPPKRRRIIDPSSISSVPIYTNKVNACLQMKPMPSVLAQVENYNTGDSANLSLFFESPTPPTKTVFIDSDEETESLTTAKQAEIVEKVDIRSPSPPPPPPVVTSTVRASNSARKKIRKLDAVCSLLSLSPQSPATRRRCPLRDDDVIIVNPNSESQSPIAPREIPLKFRCRMDLHKIPMLSSAPLSTAVEELSVKLQVPPSRILLLRKERELPIHLTASELGLSIADIIDCVVVAAAANPGTEDDNVNASGDKITVRLQGKDKGSVQEYSLHREAPLGSILSQYMSSEAGPAGCKMHFRFDGSKIKHSHTPSQLDMEDGDVIEVWT